MRIVSSSESIRRLVAEQRRRALTDPFQREGLNLHADCTSPILMEAEGRPDAVLQDVGNVKHRQKVFADMWVRCRQCEACLKHRARLWTSRAIAEIGMAPRTWFATFTLSPDSHFRVMAACRKRLAFNGLVFEALPAGEQFQERNRECNLELTKYFKRIRKNSGAEIRYLLVAEAHKSGLPHYHALIHEVKSDVTVSHRQLSDAWTLGFTKFKLVDRDDVKAAYYVAKYLAKSATSRVRASGRYGSSGHLYSRALLAASRARTRSGATLHPPVKEKE